MEDNRIYTTEEECCAMKPEGAGANILVFKDKAEFEKFMEAGKGPGREYWKKKAGPIRYGEYVPKKK